MNFIVGYNLLMSSIHDFNFSTLCSQKKKKKCHQYTFTKRKVYIRQCVESVIWTEYRETRSIFRVLYGVFFECWKIRTRKALNTGTFRAYLHLLVWNTLFFKTASAICDDISFLSEILPISKSRNAFIMWYIWIWS